MLEEGFLGPSSIDWVDLEYHSARDPRVATMRVTLRTDCARRAANQSVAAYVSLLSPILKEVN